MSEIVHPTNPEFLISNLSLPPTLALFGNTSDHERYMHAIGADGMEVTPTKVGAFMGRLLYRAKMIEARNMTYDPGVGYVQHDLHYNMSEDWGSENEAMKGLVRAQHSSFRNEANDDGLAARAVPTWRRSLEQMSRIQLITGKLPAVLYPGFEDGRVTYTNENAPFAQRTFQPTARDWRRMNLGEYAKPTEVQNTMDERGFTGITFDLFHAQAGKDGDRFHDPYQLAERLATAGLVDAVHLSLNRLDMTGFRSESAQATRYARKAFIRSAAAARKTQEGEMLCVIAKQWRDDGSTDKQRRVVLEDGPLRAGRSKKDHAAIIDHARELVANP